MALTILYRFYLYKWTNWACALEIDSGMRGYLQVERVHTYQPSSFLLDFKQKWYPSLTKITKSLIFVRTCHGRYMLIHFGEASSIFKQKCPKSSTFYTNFKHKTIHRLAGMRVHQKEPVHVLFNILRIAIAI